MSESVSIPFLFLLRNVLILLIIFCSTPGIGPVVRPVVWLTFVLCGGNSAKMSDSGVPAASAHCNGELRSLFLFGSNSLCTLWTQPKKFYRLL